jgi:preprotein translocase subunit SecF
MEALVVSGYATLGTLLFLMFWAGWPAAVASLATVAIAVAAVICCYAIFAVAIDGNLIVGLLTTIGFALNGSVAVLDRIEEHCRRQPAATDLRRAVNQGIRRAQLRSFMTALTVILGAGAVYFIGPAAFRTAGLTAGIGATAAELASLFIAPLVWSRFQRRSIVTGVSGGRPGPTRIFGF